MRTAIDHASSTRTVAVNGAVIANADIAREVQYHAGESPREAWEAATRALIVRELLMQRAWALHLVAGPRMTDGLRETDEEALIREVLEREVAMPRADEAACRRYYLANPTRFHSPDLYEPLHILFKASRDDVESYTRAAVRAEAVLAQLREAPERFESIARALSECPSAANGGRLGQVIPGDTTPEFEAALRSMKPGTIRPEPLRTRYGVHVLRLDRKVEGALLPFEQVRERISDYLKERVWRRAMAQYVAVLAGQAMIIGFDMGGAATPLVQ